MILVTLGTHPMPMDRLLRALDHLVDEGAIKDDVIVQSAAYDYRPRHAHIEGICTFAWLQQAVQRAEVVISHAGPGTLATIRAVGRAPVVVPRSSLHGEHVDDHQQLYADRLRSIPGYVVVTDLATLADAIELARTTRFIATPADVSRAVLALEALWE